MSAANAARIRTALPQAWAALIIYLCDRHNVVLTDPSVSLIIAVQPALGAVVYDTARSLERRGWLPSLSRLLLGSTLQPKYPPPPTGP